MLKAGLRERLKWVTSLDFEKRQSAHWQTELPVNILEGFSWMFSMVIDLTEFETRKID
jgi:hypothetical protein